MIKALFLKKIKLSQKTDNCELFNQKELIVMNLIAAGYNVNEIARLLHTNERAIYRCKSNILGKTNLPNISSVVQYVQFNMV